MREEVSVTRSKNMSAIRSSDTGPELLLRRALWHMGLRFLTPKGWRQIGKKRLPGNPDIIFPGARTVVFVDGCFWHGCVEHYQQPATRSEFWREKIAANKRRDSITNEALFDAGWHVIRVWEHDLRRDSIDKVAQTIRKIVIANKGLVQLTGKPSGGRLG